jgi:hypothetical protein
VRHNVSMAVDLISGLGGTVVSIESMTCRCLSYLTAPDMKHKSGRAAMFSTAALFIELSHLSRFHRLLLAAHKIARLQ